MFTTLVLVTAMLLAQGASPVAPEPILVDHHRGIPLRDGVTVYADVYRPSRSGRFPTIVVRTPYGVQRENVGVHDRMIQLAKLGYAVVNTDVRGRYESEGQWDPFRAEARDGYDVVEWAARQPWSTGKVAMQGGSYLGHVQWATLGEQPPSLVAAFPAVASTNLYANWITQGGAFHLAFNFGWGVVRMPYRIMQPQWYFTGPDAAPELRYEKLLEHLPLQTMDERAFNHPVKHWRDWLAHDSYDAYWKAISDEERFDRVQVPVMTQGGWFDIFLPGTIDGFVGVRTKGATERARSLTRMVIGPWGHGPSRKYGDLDFGADADRALFDYERRWHDFHMKGVKNGVDTDPPVQIFYMGINRWRGEQDWPIPGTQPSKWYLQPGGKLSTTAPAGEGATSYRYDPSDPVPTTGGNNCCGSPTIAGPVDQKPLDGRADIVRFTSDVLTAPVTIAGKVTMDLHATTDGKDTDWMIKLIDVYPDGKAYPMAEGILRARFREGLDKPQLLTPGQPYRYTIDLIGTAVVFQPGHRIRVDITSSNFPQFDRNLNTGDPLATGTRPRVAQQTIHHSAARPSAIVLPVVRGF
ncbi:X-Pro dipeptidyl-peptidase [Luteitalea sp. TBR-22]|uniref:CocE/NonD family hydrolase n=1 Tax=Luteitalea sp. TBR-22 TaxID=2802971 RepID=UPI001AF46E42|nr:CocE/NonD family hydrolase [Luteitalea sp. TBR-22]BCS31657.1 X-Pro dipeptidyl-peptidase [Luteitalea sp. TBR-22]